MTTDDVGVLLSPPNLSPAWEIVFRHFVTPISLVLALREKLAADLNEADWRRVSNWELCDYYKLLQAGRKELDETLATLDTVAHKTWVHGRKVRKAILPALSQLTQFNALAAKECGVAEPEKKEARMTQFRKRLFEATQKLPEFSLLKKFRKVLTAEKHIELELVRPTMDKPRFSISLPGGYRRDDGDATSDPPEAPSIKSPTTPIRKRRKRKRRRNAKPRAPRPKSTGSAPDHAKKKFPKLGIEVDIAKRIVCAKGIEVELGRCGVEWHILSVALHSYPNAYTVDSLRTNYPGEFEARAQAKRSLNGKLARIGVCIDASRVLVRIRKNSD